MPRCRCEWEGYSERARERARAVCSCALLLYLLALLLFWPDLRLRFRRSPLFLPVNWLSSPRKEIVRYGLDSERRERARELRLWLRFWFQSRIQLVSSKNSESLRETLRHSLFCISSFYHRLFFVCFLKRESCPNNTADDGDNQYKKKISKKPENQI